MLDTNKLKSWYSAKRLGSEGGARLTQPTARKRARAGSPYTSSCGSKPLDRPLAVTDRLQRSFAHRSVGDRFGSPEETLGK